MAVLISALARKSRYTEIKILVIDPSRMVKQGHRLLALQRRLSSYIQIRAASCEHYQIIDNLVLADQTGIICQSIKEPENVWANYNNKSIATNHIIQFDDLWERGIFDKDLRQLEI